MNGLAIIEKTDTETKGFFIDQDTIECARQNAKVKKRIAQAEAAKRKEDQGLRKIAKAEAKRKAYNRNTIKTVLFHGGICGAAIWLGTAGMVHPAIWIPAAIIHLCTVCVRCGEWFGRVGRK